MVFSWFGVLLRTASGGSFVATAVTPIRLARPDRAPAGLALFSD